MSASHHSDPKPFGSALIVEDHPLFSEALTMTLRSFVGIEPLTANPSGIARKPFVFAWASNSSRFLPKAFSAAPRVIQPANASAEAPASSFTCGSSLPHELRTTSQP